jgi:hypothetical protein
MSAADVLPLPATRAPSLAASVDDFEMVDSVQPSQEPFYPKSPSYDPPDDLPDTRARAGIRYTTNHEGNIPSIMIAIKAECAPADKAKEIDVLVGVALDSSRSMRVNGGADGVKKLLSEFEKTAEGAELGCTKPYVNFYGFDQGAYPFNHLVDGVNTQFNNFLSITEGPGLKLDSETIKAVAEEYKPVGGYTNHEAAIRYGKKLLTSRLDAIKAESPNKFERTAGVILLATDGNTNTSDTPGCGTDAAWLSNFVAMHADSALMTSNIAIGSDCRPGHLKTMAGEYGASAYCKDPSQVSKSLLTIFDTFGCVRGIFTIQVTVRRGDELIYNKTSQCGFLTSNNHSKLMEIDFTQPLKKGDILTVHVPDNYDSQTDQWGFTSTYAVSDDHFDSIDKALYDELVVEKKVAELNERFFADTQSASPEDACTMSEQLVEEVRSLGASEEMMQRMHTQNQAVHRSLSASIDTTTPPSSDVSGTKRGSPDNSTDDADGPSYRSLGAGCLDDDDDSKPAGKKHARTRSVGSVQHSVMEAMSQARFTDSQPSA